MKTKPTLLSFLACLSISASSLNAQSIPEPVLNIQAGNGMAVDKSEKARELTELPAGSNNTCVALNSEKAIEIPYAEGDPLFSTAEFTWILRAKFSNPGVPEIFTSVMGRWFFASNDRSAALILDPNKIIRFNLSSDGTSQNCLSEGGGYAIPEDQWRIFVFRWKQDELASLSIYGNDGMHLQTHKTAQKFLLPSIKQVSQPFLIGAPAKYGMEIKSVKVFDRALTEEELTADLLTK
jgi:hypothetical protein